MKRQTLTEINTDNNYLFIIISQMNYINRGVNMHSGILKRVDFVQ